MQIHKTQCFRLLGVGNYLSIIKSFQKRESGLYITTRATKTTTTKQGIKKIGSRGLHVATSVGRK